MFRYGGLGKRVGRRGAVEGEEEEELVIVHTGIMPGGVY